MANIITLESILAAGKISTEEENNFALDKIASGRWDIEDNELQDKLDKLINLVVEFEAVAYPEF